MGRELQKKKNKSSIPKVKHKPKSKKLNLKSNPIVAANWNKNETFIQNYRRLGLVSKLNARAGGTEIPVSEIPTPGSGPRETRRELKDTLAIANANPTTVVLGSARIIRDPKTGEVVRVVHEGEDKRGKVEREWSGRKLVDVLGSDEEDEGEITPHNLIVKNGGAMVDGEGERGMVKELVKQASVTGGKRVRKQSRREEEWVERLVERYGDDVEAMVRDRKLNSMQQSKGDIRRRIGMWREVRRKDGTYGDGEKVDT
ncbi:MAG: hypothetical protein Q9166_003714 [cf. Caloplaca sp. 2 TL-2023]